LLNPEENLSIVGKTAKKFKTRRLRMRPVRGNKGAYMGNRSDWAKEEGGRKMRKGGTMVVLDDAGNSGPCEGELRKEPENWRKRGGNNGVSKPTL